jgi:glycosyltransferase involved in cell wall biosynthesis
MVETTEEKTCMKRIIIDARESGTSTGRYIDNLVKNLSGLNPDFEIILLAKPHRVAHFEEIAPNFKVIETPYKEFTFGEQLGYLRQLKKLRADLVHFGKTEQPILYRGKTITTIHDLTTARFRNPTKNFLIFTIKQLVYKAVIRAVAKKSAAIIVPSNFVKQDLANYTHANKDKIIVTYEAGERLGEKAEPIPELAGKDFIMFNGRPQPHKNLRRLIEAFKSLHEKYPELLLAIIGKKDASYESYVELVNSLGLKNFVIFTDYVPDAQLEWAMKHTKAYIYPSLSEGFGLPGLEAMLYGAPLVSSKATCLPEVYGNAAHYFDPTNVADMASKIDEVLSSPKLQKELVQRGKEQVKKYSWAKMAAQTLDIYESILNKN